MSTYWSTYVQYPEELYRSRALRFRDDNKDLWLNAIGAADGMDVLEVGCGAGIFCHRIKRYLPGTNITGLDLDSNNIAYAKGKSAELQLDCTFVSGDANALPFDDGQFDLCFSHTVMSFCDPGLFTREQFRVLRPGGRITVMCIQNGGSNALFQPQDGGPEKDLYDRLWACADKKRVEPYQKDRPVHPGLSALAGAGGLC